MQVQPGPSFETKNGATGWMRGASGLVNGDGAINSEGLLLCPSESRAIEGPGKHRRRCPLERR